MNQILRVGKGIIIATERQMTAEAAYLLREIWHENLPDVPLVIVPESRVIEGGDDRPMMFEFTGDVTPTVIAEFRRWWEELARG